MKKNIAIATVLIVVLLVVAFNSVFVVEQGEFKVVLQFGEAVRVEDTPGLKLKVPFIERTVSYPKKQMISDSEPAPIITLDQKPIVVDNYTVWRISDPQRFIRTARTLENAEKLIDNAVYNTVRRNLSEIRYDQIISEQTARGDLNVEVTREVRSQLESNGIHLLAVRSMRPDLPEENTQGVCTRMISDRQAIAARSLTEGDEESRNIMANADRQATALVAEAQATAKRIIAEGEQE